MVSNARLDLPEPESPVTTTSLSRGISIDTFLRLCTRAPITEMLVRIAIFGGLEGIRRFSQTHEGEFLHLNVALLGQMGRNRDRSNQASIGEILAGRGYSFNIEISLEVRLDFGR